MIQFFKNINHQTVEVDHAENGAWVNILPPLKQQEFSNLSDELSIPLDFLTDSLDIDERARFEEKEDVKLIVIKTPTENNSFNESEAYYVTIPICIILTQNNNIVTVNSFENGAIKKFLNTFQNRHPDKKNMMVLKIFEKITQTYMEFLKEINQRRNLMEQKLYASNRNEELLELMKIQKSMVYFVTALRSNELLLLKLARTNFLDLSEEEKEILDDLAVDMSQALEMANIYTNILSSTLDAFASIINNNMNNVLKRLTSITIILSLPALVTGIYGMNVPIPYSNSHYAFYIPILLSVGISIVISWYFMKKKWF